MNFDNWCDVAALAVVFFMAGVCVSSWLWSRAIERTWKEHREARDIIDRNKWERLS